MRHVCFGVVVGLAVLVAGCETSVDPIVGTERAFSLYGALQPRADTQWVRVYAVKEELEPTPPESLAATVTSTDLERGRERSWRDSLIREDDGRYAHVFWTPTRVEYDHTYRLEVTGTDDRRTRVRVSVPREAALALEEPQAETAPVIAPVRVTRDVPRLINVEVEYYVQYDLPENVAGRDDPAIRLSVSYKEVPRPVEEGWIVPIDLSDDYRTLRDRLVDLELWNPAVGIVMRNMTLRLEVVNEAWDPPGGTFDPNVLVEPGAMSNVEGGFGFVGAGYRLRKQWRPEMEVLEKAGWTNPADLY
jgi:hypothetical protein